MGRQTVLQTVKEGSSPSGVTNKEHVMAAIEYYKQCVLTKPGPTEGTQELVSWIEEKAAKPGKKVNIKLSDGTWDGIWTVKSAGSNRIPKDALKLQEEAQRELAHKVAIKDDRSLGRK